MRYYLWDTFHDYLILAVHVSAEYAPYYIGWVRQVHEIVCEKLAVALSRDDEQEALRQLQRVHRKDSPVHRHHL